MEAIIEKRSCPYSDKVTIKLGYGVRELHNCPRKLAGEQPHPEWINYHTCDRCKREAEKSGITKEVKTDG